MNNNPTLTARFGITAAGAALALMLASSVFAGDATKETAAAVKHAGLAAGSDNVKAVQVHLHHVINCLVGPDGAGFDANEFNPCKDLGNGAVPDSTNDSVKQALEKAVQTAKGGLDTDDLATAQKAATETAAMLKAQ